ncbi:hypothetical protein BpHYR1_010368 [Brachionus plicatilis]|uniref:Uncharacterized protein n=1 Tax=Brachionus plicatilis TaxID=10195 RepID=A0A3M7Q516_BRAPC|nr:hypothetical protein BpHYR1_010368 [Brachionus plicatilis]
MSQQLCAEQQVPSEVRAEPRPTMRNVTRCAVEEWIWENGGRERGGLLRCRIVERRPTPILFLTMNKIQMNTWLMQMIRTTPFDGQLMICGPENYISCWVPVNGPYERTDRSRSEEDATLHTPRRETEKESEHTLVSTPGRGIELYPDSQISVRLDTLFGAK